MNNPYVPRVERLNQSKPLIERISAHPWESKVTFNPACALVTNKDELNTITARLPVDESTKQVLLKHSALCFVVYRAQGQKTEAYDYTHSSLRLAVCDPHLNVLVRLNEPVLRPHEHYENLGAEDPRITKVGVDYIMTYTAYATGKPQNRIRIAVASTKNFVEWRKHGLLKGDLNQIDNKNAMLFEQPIDGEYRMLHRPMEGTDAMTIHWAASGDVFGEWKSRGVLMKAHPNPKFKDTWIGGGAPPLRLPDGRFLILYHIGNRAADGSREYDLGLALFDAQHPRKIVKRVEPLLRPETPAETIGDKELGVNNVVFVCGAYFYEGDLIFPYAGADSVVLGGKISRAELDRFIHF